VLPVNVRHGHAERRADARESKNQQADQCPVARAHDGFDIDAVEELTRFERPQYRGLAGTDNVFGATHCGGGIDRKDLADHQPVEQHAHDGQPLLDGRWRKSAAYILEPGRHVHGFDVKLLDEASLVAPSKNSQAAR
jgi:hypothetical protein